MHTRSSSSAIAFLLLTLASAQGMAQTALQYIGQESRDIKALSESEVAGLLAGKGMGFAKSAELNGYPGPAHVLELASQLRLSEDQVVQTRALHAQMEAEAKAAGRSLVEAERELESLFRERTATPQRLTESLNKVATLQAKVREAHLKAHIEQTRLLSAQQVSQYNVLRGYTGSSERSGDHGNSGNHSNHRAHQ
jgi:hypothetical protein